MRGLDVSVYRDAGLGDCTNGGVTSHRSRLVLFADGMDGYIDSKALRNSDTAFARSYGALLLKRDKTGFRGYLYAVPATVTADGEVIEAPLPDGHVGWMMGGNYVGTSDSRFSEAVTALGAIPVHDRSESYAQYRALSSD